MPNVSNVTVGKPAKYSGQIFRAPAGTPLPRTATEALDAAFIPIGYVSDAGVVNSNTAATNQIKAWGGDIVMDVQTEKPDTFKFTLIEALNPDALKTVYGDDNIIGTLETGIKIRANSTEQKECAWVIDMIMRNDTLKRIVVGFGKVTTVGDVTYADESLVGYETTVSCYPNEAQDGDTHQEFLYRAAAPVPVATFTVTFDTDGGSAVPPQTVEDGGLVTEPADPTKDTYTFDGWYKEDAFLTPWDFATDTVTADTTIYAKWA